VVLPSANSVVLSAELRLSPLLETRVLAARDASEDLTEEERAAEEALGRVPLEVRWFFLPRFSALFGGEREVRRARLEAPQTGDTLRVTGATADLARAVARAGTYRVEFRRADRADAVVYKSEFQATVRVLAHCLRDDALFEPLPDGTDAVPMRCAWRTLPRDAAQLELLEELAVLVHGGREALAALCKQRRRETLGAGWTELERTARQRGIRLERPTPPWGATTPVAFVQLALQSEGSVRDRFSFTKLVARVVRRVANVVRTLSPPSEVVARDAATLFLGTCSQQLSKLANTAGIDYAAALVAAAPDALAAGADDIAVGTPLPLLFKRTVAQAIEATVVLFPNEARTVAVHANGASHRRALSATLDADGGAAQLAHAMARASGDALHGASLAAILQCMALPYVQLLLTAREKRFMARVAEHFERFAERYVRHELDERFYTIGELAQPLGALRAARIEAREDGPLRASINADLAALTPAQVYEMAGADANAFFFDGESFAEYQRLARALIPDVGRAARDVDCCAERAEWRGTHSALDDQPRPLQVAFRGTELPLTRAVITHHGSHPVGHNYDFGGMRAVVERQVARYNAAAAAGDVAGAAEARADVESAALVFNYFALVAPRARSYTSADKLYEELRQSRLHFETPLGTVCDNE